MGEHTERERERESLKGLMGWKRERQERGGFSCQEGTRVLSSYSVCSMDKHIYSYVYVNPQLQGILTFWVPLPELQEIHIKYCRVEIISQREVRGVAETPLQLAEVREIKGAGSTSLWPHVQPSGPMRHFSFPFESTSSVTGNAPCSPSYFLLSTVTSCVYRLRLGFPKQERE